MAGTNETPEATEVAVERIARLRDFHGQMSRHRALEDTVAEGARDKTLEGLLHLSMGAEAMTAAIMSQLAPDDRVYTAHRPHGQFMAGGADPRAIIAELAGRETGLCRGRGGTIHLTSERVVMATGIVGGSLPTAVGHALVLPEGAIAVVFFGDGAVQTGSFHEALNLAALWEAPVLFACENNGWAEFSSREEHTKVGGVVRYGELYGMAAQGVDGSDVEAVAAQAAELIAGIRSEGGPALLECHINRLRSHYEGDWRENEAEGDPMVAIEETLIGLGVDAAELTARRDADMAQLRSLLEDVLTNDPLPDPADDLGLVYARPL